MAETAAGKRQRLRRLKKQLATIESLLEEDSAAAKVAVAQTTSTSAVASSRKRVRHPPPPQTPGSAAATTKAFGARGGPANAKLRDRLKLQQAEPSGGAATDASFAAALQGNYRPQGPMSCDDTHRRLKERELQMHDAMMREAQVAAAGTVDRISARMAEMELSEARERAAAAAEARASAGPPPQPTDPGKSAAAAAAAAVAALEAESPTSALPLPESPRGGAPVRWQTHSMGGVVDPDHPAGGSEASREPGNNLDFERGARAFDPAAAAEQGRVALRSLAKELWRSFNKELAMSGPPRMPPRLRLPPPGWSNKDLEKLEVKILEAGGVPIRQLAAFSFQSSATVCGPERGPAAQKEVCAICLGNLDRPAGAGNSLRLERSGPSWLRELPCGHCFHPSCVCDWLLCEHKCPMCRHDLLEYD